MATALQTRWIGVLLSRLPTPLVSLLDTWSSGLARQRAARRQRAWQRQQLARAAAQAARSGGTPHAGG